MVSSTFLNHEEVSRVDSDLTLAQQTQLLETAIGAAKAAAIPIQAYFGKQDLTINRKVDGSPVTQADQEAEGIIRTHLRERAECGVFDVLGEEEGFKGEGTRWRWIVDPIDGTRSFIHGIPLFGTLIALLDTKAQIPVLGVIHLPMFALTYAAAKGQGTMCQGEKIQLGEAMDVSEAILSVGDVAQFRDANREHAYQRLRELSGYVRGYTDCFGHTLVIRGAIGAMVDPALNPWDILATQVLIEEAGGSMILRPSRHPQKVDALFGNSTLVDEISREIEF